MQGRKHPHPNKQQRHWERDQARAKERKNLHQIGHDNTSRPRGATGIVKDKDAGALATSSLQEADVLDELLQLQREGIAPSPRPHFGANASPPWHRRAAWIGGWQAR